MRNFQDEIVGGDNIRRYKLIDENGNVIYSGVKIEKDYIPDQEGTTFGASDMQAIQNYIATGWFDLVATLTYVSFTSPIAVFSVNVDMTAILKKGCRIRFKQGTTTYYGTISALSGSQITVTVENGTVTNTAITDVFYSNVFEPAGYPTQRIETGTWSPTIGGETTKGTMTYAVRNANYFKFGKFVHCEFMITGLNLTGSSGPLAIQDLPFVPLSKGCVSDNLGWQTVSTNVMISFSNIGVDKGKLRLGTNGQTILTNTSLSNVIVTGAFNYVCE